MSVDPYQACLQSMYGLRRFGIKLGLSTIRGILEGLGNPHNNYSSIHIAGTNGKGSVAASISSILHKAGYKVGLYTSPHLVKFNERIRINNQSIDDQSVVEAHEAVKSVHRGSREPTFFEFSTAMALYEFSKQGVDWAVIETGMGGRLDATNVIEPVLSIITNISLEHKEYLGGTIAKISREKAGIIKPYIPVVTGVTQKTAISIVEKIAHEKNTLVYRKGKSFRVRKKSDGSFSYFGIHNSWRNMRTELAGDHQVENVALSLAACEVLSTLGVKLPIEIIKEGLLETRWPGRLEQVMSSPIVILDGAHNLIAARTLGRYISESLPNKKITLVVGILNDKPYPTMLKDLLLPCDKVIITQPKIERALPTEDLYEAAKPLISDVTVIPDVKEAVVHAIKSACPEEAICIAGSLYVVGEAKEALSQQFGI